jgi:type II secretory pathway predicted ATPase ExeA
MIRSYFGLTRNPFTSENITLLPHQQTIFDTLRVHCQQGGLCLILGEPGTGKTVLKESLRAFDQKRLITPAVSRTLHTYFNTIKILSAAFQIEFEGDAFRCEKRLIENAFKLNHLGKMIAPIIDDAHLMDINCLRKLRLLFEDFPKNHNLILIGQPTLLTNISLSSNEDIKSRITYSVIMPKIAPDDMETWILAELDKAGLGHNTMTEESLALIVRSSEGIIRRARNLTIACLLETIRDQTRTVDIKQVNSVLRQPHWRNNQDSFPGYQPAPANVRPVTTEALT